jgi:hypothetical protein
MEPQAENACQVNQLPLICQRIKSKAKYFEQITPGGNVIKLFTTIA